MKEKHSLDAMLKRVRKNWPEMISPETEAVLAFIRLRDIIEEETGSMISSHGLSHISFEVLVTLRSSEPPYELSPTELYQAALCTSGGMTKALKVLEEEGYVERLSHESDKRSKLVRLNAKGAIKAGDVMSDVVRGDRNLFTGSLSEEDVTQLRDVLLPFIRKLEAN